MCRKLAAIWAVILPNAQDYDVVVGLAFGSYRTAPSAVAFLYD